MRNYIVLLLGLIPNCLGLWDKTTKLFKPHVETYWESWEEGLGNYASNLEDVPVTPVGTPYGVNVVNIAFALPNATTDYGCKQEQPPCISAGLYANETLIKAGIKKIQDAGGYVKLAIGGDTYGNTGTGLNNEFMEIYRFTSRIEKVVQDYGLDGIDLVQVRDCGLLSDCGLSEIQLKIIKSLRERLPLVIISYTFPYKPNSLLYGPVIEGGHEYLDYIVGFNGDNRTMLGIHELGVPKYKIVWGMTNIRSCSMRVLLESAEFVRSGGYGGVLTWSINSDTDHRGDGGPGDCTEFQTGHTDGTYINTLSYLLNV